MGKDWEERRTPAVEAPGWGHRRKAEGFGVVVGCEGSSSVSQSVVNGWKDEKSSARGAESHTTEKKE